MRIALAVLIGLLLAAKVAAAQDPSARTITLGGDSDWPPGSFNDEQGRPAGFDVEVARAALGAVGLEADIRLGVWAAAVEDLEQGRVDLVIAMFPNDERAERFEFSDGYHTVNYLAFARPGADPINDPADLARYEVIVERGSMSAAVARRIGVERLVEVDSERTALRLLGAGNHDYAMAARLHGMLQARDEGFPIEPVGPTLFSNSLRFAARKGQVGLLAQINRGLAEVRRSGELDEIHDRWYGEVDDQGRRRVGAWVWVGFAAAGVALVGGALWWRRRRKRGRLIGNYRPIALLGRGAMGEVWRAEHEALSREVALKLVRIDGLRGDLESVDAVRRRFLREAQAMAALKSRHTASVYDFGRARDGTLYYAMELLEGLDLRTLVEQHGPVPPRRAIHLLIGVCRSLAEAHGVGMLHRDIKPANIFSCRIDDEVDVVKVLDFGLVKWTASERPDESMLTREGFVPGTPAFLAPELVLGRGVDARADLYSLGCVAYWLLAGRPPLIDENAMAVLVAQATAEPRALSEAATQTIPPELEAIVMACLAKDPDDRPASADALRELLEQCATTLRWERGEAVAWWAQHGPPHVARQSSVSVPAR